MRTSPCKKSLHFCGSIITLKKQLNLSIFKNSRIVNIARYGEAGPGPKGTVTVATFELDGQGFMALNGGPEFSFSPAIYFLVTVRLKKK
jgi:predicted 3-demethylubiquinone-9 3-methyltransferase (glyoxalase superfamily)